MALYTVLMCLLRRASFILFVSLHAYSHRKNLEEYSQMWSGSTHYALLSGIDRTDEGRG